jgi:hypothetical protein
VLQPGAAGFSRIAVYELTVTGYFARRKRHMKTFTATYKGNRTVELPDDLDLPKDTKVFVMIPDQEDGAEIRRHLQGAAEDVFAKLWDNEEDEVWNEYV